MSQIMCNKDQVQGDKNLIQAFGLRWVLFDYAMLDELLPISTSYLPGRGKIFNNLTFSKLCHEQ